MSFITHNTPDQDIAIDMTSLQGYVSATRRQLAELFGPPMEDWGDKVTTEWWVQLEDGTVFTLYDWKRYESGPPGNNEVYQWHIGAHDRSAVAKVHDLLRAKLGLTARSAFTY